MFFQILDGCDETARRDARTMAVQQQNDHATKCSVVLPSNGIQSKPVCRKRQCFLHSDGPSVLVLGIWEYQRMGPEDGGDNTMGKGILREKVRFVKNEKLDII